MTTEERLQQAATIGDQMAELLSDYLGSGSISSGDAIHARESWEMLMGDCQRAGDISAPVAPEGHEEWGASASSRQMEEI